MQRKPAWILLWLLYSLLHQPVWAVAANEYQVKAVFLNGFSKFITWPETVFADPERPFRICVFGESPFHDMLDLVVANETWKKRTVIAEYINRIERIPDCQILYVSDSEKIRLETILSTAEKHPVLTVSDLADFVKKGGMVQFYIYRSRIRFFIDPLTIREAGLEANANLLRVANVVKR